MIEIEVSKSVVAYTVNTVAIGVLAWIVVFAATLSYAIAFHGNEQKAPRCLDIAVLYVGPAAGVVAMVLYHTLRITWVP